MSAPYVIISAWPSLCQNYLKVVGNLTKLRQKQFWLFFETRCTAFTYHHHSVVCSATSRFRATTHMPSLTTHLAWAACQRFTRCPPPLKCCLVRLTFFVDFTQFNLVFDVCLFSERWKIVFLSAIFELWIKSWQLGLPVILLDLGEEKRIGGWMGREGRGGEEGKGRAGRRGKKGRELFSLFFLQRWHVRATVLQL